ncbi:MAG TPA: prenyltransferase/squalene oxidase repeat-containing protein [Acidobacteriota bacterium]|nr:prenyltransferase/squalene oxidase repeat-containing protein [Acidobacteriota bacterium]
MKRVVLVVALSLVLVAAAVMQAVDVNPGTQDREVQSLALPAGAKIAEVYPAGVDQQLRAPAANCDGEWHGPAAYAISGWFYGNEYYAVYQDPDETGCVNTYPFEVEAVHWLVRSAAPGALVLTMQPIIYTADLTDPECPKPGVVQCLGSQFTVTLPEPGLWDVGVPISDCCVSRPYFASIYCPDLTGLDLLDILTDDGAVSPPGSRVCANYFNSAGSWDDLISLYGFPGNVKLWSEGTNSDLSDCDTCAIVLVPGVDLWETSRDGSMIPPNVFASYPVPADFFGPGSDPFDGAVVWGGDPLPTDPLGALPDVDGIVERKSAASLPSDGSSDQVGIEIVALSLVSVEPITVTYDGGVVTEAWNVRVCLSQNAQTAGIMDLSRECCLGGSFDASLPILPRFVFTNLSGPGERVLDFGLEGIGAEVYNTADGRWSAKVHPPYGLATSPGLVQIDHDCYGPTAETVIGQSSRFLRCEDESCFPDPCAPPSPDAIEKGLVWLAGQQNADGSWGITDKVGRTGLAVLKFEHYALEQEIPPLDPGYEYYLQVSGGLDYLFSEACKIPIGPQPAGNPDYDGDGVGVFFITGSCGVMTRRNYETGIALMAIAASGEPEQVINVPVSPVHGLTHVQVAQDVVEYLAFGQNDGGFERGGWGYYENHVGMSTNSNSGFVVSGLAYAESFLTGAGLVVPDFVKTELDIWIAYIQCTVFMGPDDGGSGYTAPCVWVNTLKTGNLLAEMAFAGDLGSLEQERAVAYMVRHWYDPNNDPGWINNYMAMWCIMKGLKAQHLDAIDGIDWFEDISGFILANQLPDGSWRPDLWGDNILTTTWALLTLEKDYLTPSCCIGLTGNIDCDPAEVVDIGDLTALIRYLFIPPIPTLCCPEEANVDGDLEGIIDIGDLTALIAYLFISPNPDPAPCL